MSLNTHLILSNLQLGGVRWRIFNELVAPCCVPSAALATAFVAAGGVALLIQLADAPPNSFVDDLYPADRALRPRFPCPAPEVPSAIIASAALALPVPLIDPSTIGSDPADSQGATFRSALVFGRAASVALPPACPTVDPPALVSFRFAAVFFLSILANNEVS